MDDQCKTLGSLFPNSTAFPNSSAYDLDAAGYWSNQQRDVTPTCYFEPARPKEVGIAVLLARVTKCPFAVKSGGHFQFANSSNIEDGITITLQRFNKVKLSADAQSVSIGPGLRWSDVYRALEPYNITALGGRVSDIGVGGLITGGGISYFSGRYGWACDNVINYELVTADGAVINVNATGPYTDLFWALRGGSNNFGIVTRFDVKTIPQGVMWGGNVLYSSNYTDAIVKAFVEYSITGADDLDSELVVPWIYTSYTGHIIIGQLEHARPQPESGPQIFSAFKKIPAIIDMTKTDSQVNITDANLALTPRGLRQTYWTATYKMDEDVLRYIAKLFVEEVDAIANLSGLQAAMPMALIEKTTIAKMSANGGNPLGLKVEDAPLLLLNAAFSWSDAADDYKVLKACQNIVDKSVEFAKSKGKDHPYLYLNYASQFQDVFASYGEENLQRLKDISKHYDRPVFSRSLCQVATSWADLLLGLRPFPPIFSDGGTVHFHCAQFVR
ncbi:FAD-binding domain-containing protein [Teratosphaeria destructans]|uniref:FAD-binding domain-containing protein n=1 Tax=Teratosphaeria destructans TaxID=418781 RepID=A0A9W7W3K1_9PEZI|nr:FAD-binding domain-containing protein [Teratosphaeria destructans]